MASMMMRLTVGDLKEMLEGMDDKEFIGHLFSVTEDVDATEHQVLVFYNPVKPM